MNAFLRAAGNIFLNLLRDNVSSLLLLLAPTPPRRPEDSLKCETRFAQYIFKEILWWIPDDGDCIASVIVVVVVAVLRIT